MAKAAGSSGPSNRGMMEALIFMVLVVLVCVEFWAAFKDWWPIMGKWCERNPITAPVLGLGLLMGPITGLMHLNSTGKKLGDEAEEIRRGMRR